MTSKLWSVLIEFGAGYLSWIQHDVAGCCCIIFMINSILLRYRLSPSFKSYHQHLCAPYITLLCLSSPGNSAGLSPTCVRPATASTKPPLAVALSPSLQLLSRWLYFIDVRKRKGRNSRQTKSTCGSLHDCTKKLSASWDGRRRVMKVSVIRFTLQ